MKLQYFTWKQRLRVNPSGLRCRGWDAWGRCVVVFDNRVWSRVYYRSVTLRRFCLSIEGVIVIRSMFYGRAQLTVDIIDRFMCGVEGHVSSCSPWIVLSTNNSVRIAPPLRHTPKANPCDRPLACSPRTRPRYTAKHSSAAVVTVDYWQVGFTHESRSLSWSSDRVGYTGSACDIYWTLHSNGWNTPGRPS